MIIPTLIAQFSSFEPQSPLNNNADVNPAANLETIISNVFGFMTILGAMFFLVYFVIAALGWITSGGDSGKLEKSRNKMINGVLGLIILVSTYAIVGLIGNLVGIEILNPAELIKDITPGN